MTERLRPRKRTAYEVYSSGDSDVPPRGLKRRQSCLLDLKDEATKEHRREYYRDYRANLTPDQKERASKQARERMRKYRERKKMEIKNTGVRSQRKQSEWEATLETQRALWRESKRKQLERETVEAKQKRLAKRKQKYKEKSRVIKFSQDPKEFAHEMKKHLQSNQSHRSVIESLGIYKK